jgi:hypothetical protein
MEEFGIKFVHNILLLHRGSMVMDETHLEENG